MTELDHQRKVHQLHIIFDLISIFSYINTLFEKKNNETVRKAHQSLGC